MRKYLLLLVTSLFLCMPDLLAQVYMPVPVTGFTHDVFAETIPNTLTCTDTVLDLTNHIMYTSSFAAGVGLSGGLPNSGTITDPSGNRQYQLASYSTNNVMMVTRNVSRSLTLSTPAQFTKLSLLCFSTEGASTINISVRFIDGSITNYITNYSLADWFNGATNQVITGFGRCQRVAAASYGMDGYPTNPRFYYIDINLNCADQQKTVQSITVANVSTGINATFPCAAILAVSGAGYTQTIGATTTPAYCSASNGGASLTINGNTGGYSITWNTTPVQSGPSITNVPAGNYTAVITDAGGCVTNYPVTIPQQASPVTVTATASPAVICKGDNTTLNINATGGTLGTVTWNPGTLTGNSVVVSPNANTTTYTASGQDQYGCSFIASVTVTANDTVTTPSLAATAFCAGQTSTLTVQNPDMGATYQWFTTNAGGTAVATGINFQTPNLTAPATFYVEAASASGCTNKVRVPLTVTPNALPAAPSVTPVSICSGEQTILSVQNVQAGYTYDWFTVATGGTSLFTGTSFQTPVLPSTTAYYIEATNGNGCTSNSRGAVTVTTLPVLAKPVVTVFNVSATSITFSWSGVPGATGYEVSTDGGTTFTPPSSGNNGTTHTINNVVSGRTVTLQVRALGSLPCQTSAWSDPVSAIIPDKRVFVPNVFTPNGDGKNDELKVYVTSVKMIDFEIFNQWGELVFRSTDPAKGWDGSYKGQQQPVGVYVYALQLTMTDGTQITKKGSINLIR